MTETILMFEPLLDPLQARLEARYDIVWAKDAGGDTRYEGIRAVVSGGGTGLPDAWFDRLPDLGLIAINGVGTDKVDLDEAARRKIHVATTPNVLTDDVADLGIALTLAVLRSLREGENLVRDGRWAAGEKLPLSRSLKGKKFGIVGLGQIGQALGERAAAFRMEVGFWNRSPKTVAGWTSFASVKELAGWADILAIAVAATPQTDGLVDAAALVALGEEGVLVNVARGSVVDEAALLDALESRAIAGAGLDVFHNEPKIDPRFLALDTVFLAPHQGSATVETRTAMAELVWDNLDAFFAGRVPPTSLTADRFA